MKALIQRVSSASVAVAGEEIGEIGWGILVLLGVGGDDSERDIECLAEKIIHLRIFSDEQGKMNLSLVDIQGSVLVVSQFTLYADCKKGRRPAYTDASPPDKAEKLYNDFVDRLRSRDVQVATGKFQAMMGVRLVNDGPVTIMLETQGGKIV